MPVVPTSLLLRRAAQAIATRYPIEEDPLKKKLRMNYGHKVLVEVDASKLRAAFEAQEGEKLAWNSRREKHLGDHSGSIDAYPMLLISKDGKIQFQDGRHRVHTAAERGMTIQVAVPNQEQARKLKDILSANKL